MLGCALSMTPLRILVLRTRSCGVVAVADNGCHQILSSNRFRSLRLESSGRNKILEEKQNVVTDSYLHDQEGRDDNFLQHFKEEVMAVHERIGVPIVGTWVNRSQNEFIWVRSYKDKADLEANGKAFQAEVAKSGDQPSPRWKSARSSRRRKKRAYGHTGLRA